MLHKVQKACNSKFNIHYDNPSELIEMYVHFNVPYILESNLHTFYSFRGLKKIICGLESCAD